MLANFKAPRPSNGQGLETTLLMKDFVLWVSIVDPSQPFPEHSFGLTLFKPSPSLFPPVSVDDFLVVRHVKVDLEDP